jgi:hypothetical protein
MAAKTSADEFAYAVPGWYWEKNPDTALRSARAAARRKRKNADGEPVVHVILVWPQQAEESAA